MDGYVDGCVDGYVEGYVDGCVDGYVDGYVEGYVDGYVSTAGWPSATHVGFAASAPRTKPPTRIARLQ